MTIRLLSIIVCSFLLASCGGGGGGSDTVAFSNIPTGIPYNSSAAKTTAFVAGDVDCPTGGILVQTGIDKNGNSILDTSEVTVAQKVCNGAVGPAGPAGSSASTETDTTGATGITGLSALVNINSEVAGANCATGGVRIDTGLDINRSNVIDASEITATKYVCNGATGASGTSGSGSSNIDATTVNALIVGTWSYTAYSHNDVDDSFKTGYGTLTFQSNGNLTATDESNIFSTAIWTVENNTILKITNSIRTTPFYIQRVSANQIDLSAVDGFLIMKK